MNNYDIKKDKKLTPDETALLMREVLNKSHSFSFRARGQSMLPFIADGDLLKVYPIEAHTLKIGDIIAVSSHESPLIVHRIISKRKSIIITKGDNNRKTDEPVTYENVIGKIEINTFEKKGMKKRITSYPFLIAIFSRLNLLNFAIKLYLITKSNKK